MQNSPRPGSSPQAMSPELREVYAALLERAPENRIEPDLSRITRVMELMGDPQNSYRSIRIAGTNGKTTTARILERILREAGLRTGRTTSPHLRSPVERIAIDGASIDEEGFLQAYHDVAPFAAIVDAEQEAAGGVPLTYFEYLTAMAFQAFASAPVDVAVIETGLGGTWDATGAVHPDVAVITPISLDHQDYLGDTIAEIAAEKAGILTAEATAILASQPYEDAADVLRERIGELGAEAAVEDQQIGVLSHTPGVGGQMLSLQGIAGRYEEVFLSLLGEHQARNALLAVAAAEALLGDGRTPLGGELLSAALSSVTSPGRAEVVRQAPTILLDAAHNPAGALTLVETVRENFRFTRTVGLVGILREKDAAEILDVLEPLLDSVVITQSSSPRAIPTDVLADIARDIFQDEDRVVERASLPDAIQAAVDLAETDGDQFGGVVVAGSVTLTGEVRELLGVPEEE
ncbi:Dihydrofolate synthase @ Folylpolyglutamate synthase [Brachybacterium faecium]|uniref:tetrahydrofolate synthase n=1 Tax=Brachybacterium faecium (strain ATCC 43885 / DSM 4810 / JCM 11609 / LMG 19847 / NBRC 14762 / NCIMB 9860 / 6-10) TaxID=446465 RepID=C7MB66_BRAFD|nr:folylpolyglutamate synthase/dihydrofolate synthase family protein [Brachybacterium faecium]ACU84839.1 folylpolyglutamate synthase/dihydrofolate synthase [Brachybacterium faecium DSM 4810]SLM97166.1 Dihydrofolate synthase @ Folylpolyglutamate synthase [Brachybacterium faecium]